MEIYQGEPLTGSLFHKKNDGTYATAAELQTYQLIAVLKDFKGSTIKTWKSSTSGDFTYDTQNNKGRASFKIVGNDTKNLTLGLYTFEISKEETDGKAVGVLKDVVTVKQCNIKDITY